MHTRPSQPLEKQFHPFLIQSDERGLQTRQGKIQIHCVTSEVLAFISIIIET